MKISLKALRVNQDLTQEEAAKKLGISERTLQNWECYNTFPTMKQLMAVCAVYECGLDDIFLPDTLALSEEGGND